MTGGALNSAKIALQTDLLISAGRRRLSSAANKTSHASSRKKKQPKSQPVTRYSPANAPAWTLIPGRVLARWCVTLKHCCLVVLQFVDGCRQQVLPAVCKQWKELLAGPSEIWQNIRIHAGMKHEYYKAN